MFSSCIPKGLSKGSSLTMRRIKLTRHQNSALSNILPVSAKTILINSAIRRILWCSGACDISERLHIRLTVPSSIERVGDRHSIAFVDFTLRVICITDAQSLDTALTDGLPNHPNFLSGKVLSPSVCLQAIPCTFSFGMISKPNVTLSDHNLDCLDSAPTSLCEEDFEHVHFNKDTEAFMKSSTELYEEVIATKPDTLLIQFLWHCVILTPHCQSVQHRVVHIAWRLQ